jgi:biopolymer transport protein ExbD
VKIRRRVGSQSVIPTASMADIAMLLLIFFMSTTIIGAQEQLGVRLPAAYAGDRIPKEYGVRISLAREGRVALNDAEIDLESVGPVLAEKLRRQPGLTISLHADAQVPYASVARLIEQLQAAQAARVSLATHGKEPR